MTTDPPRLGPAQTLCGGCAGMGAHKRWCPVVVGAEASRRGKWSEQIEAMADSVGSNNPIAANHLYRAAAMLLADAMMFREEFRLPAEDV